MSYRTLAIALFSGLALTAAGCSSPLEIPSGQVSDAQGVGGTTVVNDTTGVADTTGVGAPYYGQPHLGNGADDPANHDVGDDRGVDDPATHDIGDDRGADDPAGHDVGDDHGGDRGDNGSGGGGADDPANHQ